MALPLKMGSLAEVASTAVAYAVVLRWTWWLFYDYLFHAFTSVWGVFPVLACLVLWKAGSEKVGLHWLAKVFAYTLCVQLSVVFNFWRRLHTPNFGKACSAASGMSGSGLDSDVKVILNGLPKSGTSTITRAFHDLGLRAYHGEDTMFSEIGIDFLRELEGHADGSTSSVGRAELARSIFDCRVEVMSFDLPAKLMEHVLLVSSKAQIVFLDWQSAEEWSQTFRRWDRYVQDELVLAFATVGAMRGLVPWAYLSPWVDPLFGSPISQRIQSGHPSVLWGDHSAWFQLNLLEQLQDRSYRLWGQETLKSLWMGHAVARHEGWSEVKAQSRQHFFRGYWQYWRNVSALVPDRVVHVNPMTTTYESLCKIADLEPCPLQGPLYREPTRWRFARLYPLQKAIMLSVVACLHRLHFLIFCRVWTRLSRLLASCCRPLRRRVKGRFEALNV
mmetsp:Transcript_54301/g.129401  ORF Transcript_54301/g.129401 Transcript_54301/m.129401 type:complete len:445 (+) Transcript_54301:102-1436(+)